MSNSILVLNSGSSSVKYRLFDLTDGERVLAAGLIERIGEQSGTKEAPAMPDHRQAIGEMVRRLADSGHLCDESELLAVGHRVVHGGEHFSSAALVDEGVVAAIRDAFPLAPLHNPPNLTGIEVCRERWPLVPQIAVFDTAFHQSMPPEAYRYALPESLYRDSRIRRYGFHGTSFAYVTKRAGAYLGRDPDSLNLIALHLGNGASAAAIRNGRSVDTSMGMTPLAGLMMGTRCGDIDPGVLIHLLEQQDRAVPELGQLLNKESGLKGIAGSNDMRDVLAGAEAGNAASRLAIDMYAYRIRKYVGAYWAILGRVDALVFTGGIGEHAPVIRREACRDLENLGIELDQEANLRTSSGIAEIQSAGSRVRILIVPTDEELEIARQSVELLGFSRAS